MPILEAQQVVQRSEAQADGPFICPVCCCAYKTRTERDDCWRDDLRQQALSGQDDLAALMGED